MILIAVACLMGTAFGEEHWAWRSLERPEVPNAGEGWARNDVDRFVAAVHDAHGLTHAPEADRRTLIRRLTFNLHGLPPTPEEIEAFVNDPSPDAYEHLVNRLLDSPRYGERWARHWLDLVHYGETHGFDKDQRRDNAWPYRDYVIQSLNDDKPYARFVEEQIAGDVLYPEDPQATVATGFIAAGPWDLVGQVEVRDGTVEKRRVRNLDRDDMVTSVTNTFLSTTAQCARCHDHKFDPIAIEDYYEVQAVFAGVDRGDRDYEPIDTARERNRLTTKRDATQKLVDELTSRINKAAPERYHEAQKEIADLREKVKKSRESGSPTNGYHSTISNVPDDTHWVEVDFGQAYPINELKLFPARPTDFRDTPGFGFPIRFMVETASADGNRRAILDHRETDYRNPGDIPVTIQLDGSPVQTVRITATHLWERTNDYAFALAELEAYGDDGVNVARGKVVRASSSIDYGRWHTKNLVDGYDSRKRLDKNVDDAPWKADEAKIEALETESNELLTAHVDNELLTQAADARKALNETRAAIAKLPKPNRVWAAKPVEPRPIHVLHRGSVTAQKDLVKPAALSMVQGMEDRIAADSEGIARAEFAKWITRKENGLTWRSIANRVWQYHIGHGFVSTPNDFGLAGATPTHPELLEWLACEIRDNGGSLKDLHRTIVTSATYRQASTHNAENAAIDGSNQYLWRANRQKLDAESMRDAILVVSGKMDFAMGGPSFKLFSYTHDHSPKYDYVGIDEPEVWRRSVYRYIVRSVPNPMLEALDCADPNINTPKRNQTLTALQALVMLNDAFVLQQSQYFAERMKAHSADRAEQLRFAMHTAIGREPTSDELNRLVAFAEAEGLPSVARMMFNLNEFMFID